jgi:trans-2,3-dihydro-3-hydroxyanthranilate isomerase
MRYQTYSFYTVDVFTEKIFGGNPLVIFPNAQGLNSKQMQQIAQEFNISETVFVFPPHTIGNDRRLRIFTPKTEIPFAGHPTIGTAYLLTTINEIPVNNEITKINFEEGVGTISVTVKAQIGKSNYCAMTITQDSEYDQGFCATEDLAQMLSLKKEDILTGNHCQGLSCGLPFLFIPLTSVKALQKAQLNRTIWQKLLSDSWANNIYIFTHSPELTEDILCSASTHLWRSRMFAPALGIEEDPATGSAASAFAAYLGIRNPQKNATFRWIIEQGFEMGRPSLIQVEGKKENEQMTEIKVGGNSVLVSQGLFNVPFSEE